MATKFLLDPRVLDDCVGDGVPDVEIEAEGAAFFKHKHSRLPVYYFYLNKSTDAPPSLLGLPHSEVNASLMRTLFYQRANVNFIQLKSTDGQRQQILEKELSAGSVEFDALYVREKFLQGNAELMKMYGVAIKPEDDEAEQNRLSIKK